jgi:hypothetical protein
MEPRGFLSLSLSLSLSLGSALIAALCGAGVRAQALGVHPHIAPISNPNNPPAGLSRASATPQFNVPNQSWDNGEGFRKSSNDDADHGGHLGNAEPGVELGDIWHISQTLAVAGPGWQPLSYTDPRTQMTVNLWHFVGYLRPAQLGPYPGPGDPNWSTVLDAAFELFLPNPIPANDPNPTLLIEVWPTKSKPKIEDGGRHAYPGARRADGLPGTTVAIDRGSDPMIVAAAAAAGRSVMSGYITTRIFGRPQVFGVQRARELVQAMRQMLGAPLNDFRHPPGLPVIDPDSNSVPVAVAGGSHGGATVIYLCTRYPSEFHGGAISVFGYGMRRVVADQYGFEYFATRGGFSPIGGAYSPEDTLEWGTAARWLDPSPGSPGWDYHNLSPLLRWNSSPPQFHRPLVWHAPDEDTIAHGTDSLSLITGTRTYTQRFVTPTAPELAFAAVDKRCHDAGWYTTALEGVPNAWHPRDQTIELIKRAEDSHGANPSPPAPQRLTDSGLEDPYAWVLDRVYGGDAPFAGQPLQLDPSFGNLAGSPATPGRTIGAGLCLGRDESLRFAVVNNEKSVFCGSADGVVTRFVVNVTTTEFEVKAQSMPLGHGAFALAVGEFDGMHAGPELVVGTKQHLFVLDAASLALLPNRTKLLPYEHTGPRRIQIGNVFDSYEYDGEEVSFISNLGHFVVMAGDAFGTMTDLGEPGIQDFAVLSGHSYASIAPGTSSVVPVALLSHRGHLANVTLNEVSDPSSRTPHPAKLHAWTAGEHGYPADLELVTAPANGKPVFACLYAHEGTDGTADVPQIRCFDALTLQPTDASYGIPPGLGWKELGLAGDTDSIALDLAPVHAPGANGALLGFVVLTGDRIAWVAVSGGLPARLQGYELDGFPPASRAIGLLTADLNTRPGESYREEIVLSTLGGHVVWFHLEDMLANGSNPYLELVSQPMPNPLPDGWHSNRTLAGQWGFLAHDAGQGLKLFGANQSGELFATDPVTGQGSRQEFLREPGRASALGIYDPGRVVAPIRDLAYLGFAINGTNNAAERALLSSSVQGSSLRWLQTRPWQNLTNDVLHPLWSRDLTVINQIEVNWPTVLPIALGLAAFVGGGGALSTAGSIRQAHWWGGDARAYTNLIQGALADPTQVLDNWYSSKDVPYNLFNVPPGYFNTPPSPLWRGTGPGDCKDLRNEVRTWAAINQMQSLRVTQDGNGPLIVASTVGGSLVILRPGQDAGGPNQSHGTILWDSASGTPPFDEGLNVMGLALREVPGTPGQVDIFAGVGITHLDPAPWRAGSGPGRLCGGIAWYRWTGAAPLQRMGLLHLDPNSGNAIGERGGFGVCGLAIGDVLATEVGDELVATTLEGDLFVFRIPASGMLAPSDILFRSWARGALGVNNAIAVLDAGGDSRKELFIAGSLGIWKWRQP